MNRYAFERNNPQVNTDPTGHVLPLIVVGGIIVISAAIIGGGVSAIVQYKLHREVDLGKVAESAVVAGVAAAITLSPAALAASIGAYGLGATLGFWYVKFFTFKICLTVMKIFITSKILRWFYVFSQTNPKRKLEILPSDK